MAKKSEFPEHLNLRLTTAQRTFLNDMAALHELKPSDIIRGFIESARADRAIERIESAYPR